MYKIIALIIEYTKPQPKKYIKVAPMQNHRPDTLEWKGNKPFNKEKIIEYLKDHYNCTEKDIIWPDYIEIPKL